MKTFRHATMAAAILTVLAATTGTCFAQEATGQYLTQNDDRTVSELVGVFDPNAFDDRIEVSLAGGQILRIDILDVEEITDTTITVPWTLYEVFGNDWRSVSAGKFVIDLVNSGPGSVLGWSRMFYVYDGFQWVDRDSGYWAPVALTAPL